MPILNFDPLPEASPEYQLPAPRRVAQANFRIVPFAVSNTAAELTIPTGEHDLGNKIEKPQAKPPSSAAAQRLLARESKKLYRQRGANPRKISAENNVPPGQLWKLDSATVDSPPDPEALGSQATTTNPSPSAPPPAPKFPRRERLEKRLNWERGPPRRAPNAGFRIRPFDHGKAGSAKEDSNGGDATH